MERSVRRPDCAEAEASGKSPGQLLGTCENNIQATLREMAAERDRRTTSTPVPTEAAPLEHTVTKIGTESGVMGIRKNQTQIPAGLFYLHLPVSRRSHVQDWAGVGDRGQRHAPDAGNVARGSQRGAEATDHLKPTA